MVVVTPAIDTDPTASEELLQLTQDMRTRRCLDDRELGLDFQPSFALGCRKTGTEKQPSPATKPTTHCSNPGLSC